jgi:hypothetical protein
MASREPAVSGRSQSKKNARSNAAKGQSPARGAAERDETYGLISAIYHSLQGAETCSKYIEDARRAGSDDLAAFFEEWQAEQNRRALLGRRLLADELTDLEEEVDDILDEDADT